MADQTQSQSYHSTHSYKWSLGQRKPMTQTCDEAGTVEDSLRRSSLFKNNEEKNKHKRELVVERDGNPIASHFPCTLIQPGAKLVVKFVKSKSAGSKAVKKTKTCSSNQMVVFNLKTKGAKNIARILINPALRSYSEVTVYAYKGEKVKHALKRDGRFLKSIFKKTCALSNFTTNVEMSNLVDDLDGKTFQIFILNNNSPPESQPSSLEGALDTLEPGKDSDNTLEQGNDNDDSHEQGNNNDDTLEQGNNNDDTLKQGNDNDDSLEQGNDNDDSLEQGNNNDTLEQGNNNDDTLEQGNDNDDSLEQGNNNDDTLEQGNDNDDSLEQGNNNDDSLEQGNNNDDTLEQGNDNDDSLEQGNNNDDTLEQGNDNDANRFGEELHEIPDSREMRSHLSSLVRDVIETKLTGQKKDHRQLQSVEYGRNQGSVTVETMKKLMNLSDSVCQVRIRGNAVGSGFHLFSSFVLTNFHVINPVFNQNLCQLSEPVSVHFSFESLDQAAGGHEVKEVVVGEYGVDVEGHKCDWVLLELNADQSLPQSLLEHFGFVPESGSICIIGHPHGNVKRVDQSWILTINSHSQIIEKHYNENLKYSKTGEVIQFVTPSFAEGVAKALYNNRDLTYETCFFFGSSGSPVFDNHCNVVAMHSGGFVYESSSGETQSVIEFGHPLSSILENLIVQLVHRGRLDVLKQCLVCFNKHHEAIIHNVKKLVTSRSVNLFQHTANRENVSNDDTLKRFFEFVCEPDSPVSMDIE